MLVNYVLQNKLVHTYILIFLVTALLIALVCWIGRKIQYPVYRINGFIIMIALLLVGINTPAIPDTTLHIVIGGHSIEMFDMSGDQEYFSRKDQLLDNIVLVVVYVPPVLTNIKMLYFLITKKNYEEQYRRSAMYRAMGLYIISVLMMITFGTTFTSVKTLICWQIGIVTFMFVAIRYMQGFVWFELDENGDGKKGEDIDIFKITLKEMRENAVPERVYLWRKGYLLWFLGLIFFWILCSIVHSS